MASRMSGLRSRLPGVGSDVLRIVALVAVGLLVIAAVVTFLSRGDAKTLTADFPRTVSVYEGSDVRVLGVKVGEVDTVKPAGTSVEVTMHYDADVDVPADAKAAVIAPSVVGDRFVQLTPVYTSGPVLEDGATLGTDRTATPLELDQIYEGIDDLMVGLGPEGANQDGALTRLLRSTADNFGGQGRQFNETIRNLSKFTGTLDDNKDALFQTVTEVERFVKTLAKNDQTVRDFNDSLASAAGVLEGERSDLSAALHNLGVATEQVASFVRENRDALSRNVKGLVQVTGVLVKQRDALDEILKDAPVALTNLFHTYNKNTGTLDTRTNLGQNLNALTTDPVGTLCSLISPSNPASAACDQLSGIFKGLEGGGLGRGRAGALSGPDRASNTKGKGVVVIEHVDPTLAGLVEVNR